MAEIANNHFWRQKWTMDRFNSTILSDIWPELILFSGWATMVTLLTELTEANLAISPQLLTVGGIVMALVVSFRTSSAYERYQEGNKMWTNIRTVSRTLGQLIWFHVSDERKDGEGKDMSPLQVIMEKRTMIKIHLLRDEPGVFYEDLYPSVAFLPKFAAGTDHAHDILPLWHVDGGRMMKPVMPGRKDTLLEIVKLENPPLKPAHIPPEITIYDYFDALANLDRICNNPIPFGYQVPPAGMLMFQLVGELHYITIPAMAFVAFFSLVFSKSGKRCKRANPFNYGLNDLDLDWFCNAIKRSLEEITAQPNWEPSDFIFDNRNQPFAPLDKRGAADLANAPNGEYQPLKPDTPSGMDGVRRVLVCNWKQVDSVTRRPMDSCN
ncbi:hypothetical protein BKA70DRAFT_1269086 [Coprinopsis sp. MPI-PUGE-AT-0042]|nr:hypothetical protein BKA70DRAFT_1269086 [Coprinopsis sp. MPI-PUGE-AT-0042]